jgi:hypothetical protein
MNIEGRYECNAADKMQPSRPGKPKGLGGEDCVGESQGSQTSIAAGLSRLLWRSWMGIRPASQHQDGPVSGRGQLQPGSVPPADLECRVQEEQGAPVDLGSFHLGLRSDPSSTVGAFSNSQLSVTDPRSGSSVLYLMYIPVQIEHVRCPRTPHRPRTTTSSPAYGSRTVALSH